MDPGKSGKDWQTARAEVLGILTDLAEGALDSVEFERPSAIKTPGSLLLEVRGSIANDRGNQIFTCASLAAGVRVTRDRTTDLPDVSGRYGMLGVGRQHRGERAECRRRDLIARPTDRVQDRSRCH